MKQRILFLILHGLAGWFSLRVAFLARFYLNPLPDSYLRMMWETLPLALIAKALAAETAGLTRRLWKYATFQDLRDVLIGAALGSLFLVPVAEGMTRGHYPNGPLLLDFLFTVFFFGLIRFSGRLIREGRQDLLQFQRKDATRVLILGAGDHGERAIRYLRQGSRSGIKLVGVLDEDPEKKSLLLHGVRILGPLKSLKDVLTRDAVDEVVVALPDAGRGRLREVFLTASACGCTVGILPDLQELRDFDALANPIRTLKLSDFLGREPVKLDPKPIEEGLRDCVALITGAGGSIGSELARQLAAFPLKALYLLDQSESALFDIDQELREEREGLHLVTLLCDVRSPEDVRAAFAAASPDVVFHAAACKHVPMMEAHPLEAARTNVLGTHQVVRAACEAGVKRFLHVSTDKAVAAESVMGASKALSEQIILAAAASSGFAYSCVRFGNVLGSSGSVIPLFEKQLKRSGILRVTHEDATRYFMTIEEAVQLLIHAESLRGRGEVFLLDMGEPVKIRDLAEQMLRLSGRTGGADAHIQLVGLRPGERLHERLHTDAEDLLETGIPKIRKIKHARPTDTASMRARIAEVELLVRKRDAAQIRSLLFEAVK